MSLEQKRCLPCEGFGGPLPETEAQKLHPFVPDWKLADGQLSRTFRFADFRQAMRFVNRMADLAEEEGHHPDFTVHFNQVHVTIFTHAHNGLTENDFVLAAKIDLLPTA